MNNYIDTIAKLKLTLDHHLSKFSKSYKLLFCVEKMGITSPKEVSAFLNMAKSNLAILAGKLRLQKYLVQQKINKKEIRYKVTPLGQIKLDEKLQKLKISSTDQAQINKIAGQVSK